MTRRELAFPEGAVECIEVTRKRGTILCAASADGQNGMAIGWVNIGSIWGRPVCTVLVRPSRHTFGFMEAGDSFTVNVLGDDRHDAVDLFGTRSGRDMDKFKEAGLTPAHGLSVNSPFIAEADLVVECKTACKQRVDPELILADFVKSAYAAGDYHTVYFGEILSIHAK